MNQEQTLATRLARWANKHKILATISAILVIILVWAGYVSFHHNVTEQNPSVAQKTVKKERSTKKKTTISKRKPDAATQKYLDKLKTSPLSNTEKIQGSASYISHALNEELEKKPTPYIDATLGDLIGNYTWQFKDAEETYTTVIQEGLHYHDNATDEELEEWMIDVADALSTYSARMWGAGYVAYSNWILDQIWDNGYMFDAMDKLEGYPQSCIDAENYHRRTLHLKPNADSQSDFDSLTTWYKTYQSKFNQCMTDMTPQQQVAIQDSHSDNE
ncbi:hypothetical protein [Gardnerella vaginalis]|uniref:hypothetical protein n=1 Tax=Gardnerella vaginalis TaxID=2702 RepID=UPI000352A343|nr:hypothetical protein [Gardnerella vaginalis]EPI41185.1 hypothetical protein HMPREF1585_01302 [Gardnerella vaginalis JCP8481B]EPI41729.1 hypothetical protein HMPREF1584_01311 [Gardnerella vaginalis JCP8481A]